MRTIVRLLRPLVLLPALAAALQVASTSDALARPLPPGAQVSRPCRGPSVADVPMSRSVDAFDDAVYDVDLEARGGRLSRLLTLRYEGGIELYVSIDDVGDESMDAASVIREVIDHGAVCDGGRVFPRRMNRSTTPRLWSVRRLALQTMDDHNAAFILGHAFPAVFTILVATTTTPGAPPPTASRRPLPGRMSVPPLRATSSDPAPVTTAKPRTMAGGRAYDGVRRFDYPHRELIIEKPDGSRVRLDAYDPRGAGEIVSRKFTQLADVQQETALGYVRELATKYRPGDRIANVASSGPLAGQILRGRQILEVPVQLKAIPRAVLELAYRLRIIIRDVDGKVY